MNDTERQLRSRLLGRFLHPWAIAAFLLVWSTSVPAQSLSTSPAGVDQIFTHPQLGFQILVPGEAVLTEHEAPMIATIRSRKGWGVNIQVAERNPQSTVEDMVARLESRNLGNGKTWSEKHVGRSISAFGQTGYEGIYAGSGMKARLVLLRTATIDYVLMFISPAETYVSSVEIFDRMLTSFRPSQSAVVPTTFQEPDSTVVPQDNASMALFHDKELGYSMMYPAHWKVNRPNPSTAIFGGPRGTEAAYTTISVQNVAPPVAGTDRLVLESVIQELQAQMAYSVSDIRHTTGKPFFLGSADSPVEVFQFLSDYRAGDTVFRQWTLAMPRPGEGVIHVWTYIAPIDQFSQFQHIAEKMAGSWTIEPVIR